MDFGLCDSCKHQRIVKSGRGSVFSMCEIGQTDPKWPKYPRMPVVKCLRHDPQVRAGNEAISDGHEES